MIEEDPKDTTITNEDLDVLRILLHNIRGISAVSSTTAYTQRDEQSEE
jgi:hypothetical protein